MKQRGGPAGRDTLTRVSSRDSVNSYSSTSSYSNYHSNSNNSHLNASISDLPDLPDDMVDSSSRIRVVVRVRPFHSNHQMNTRGLRHAESKNILFPNGDQQIVVWDPVCLDSQTNLPISESACWSRKFSFDKCLWSDQLTDGSVVSSQDDVYNQVGSPVVRWMLEGFNCCVLAYGQTGAGKSYTMMGDIDDSPKEFGLVPRICYGLFEMLDQNAQEPNNSDEVFFSHMEIYNEAVKDLLMDPQSYSNNRFNGNSTTSGLRVREHPQHGVFVSGLTTVRVSSFEDVMSLISIGDKNRTVAATNSNIHSSRSHAIVTLTLLQRTRQAMRDGLPTTSMKQKVSSRVHLVDLAGSERVTLSGAQGDRLKEANNINKSLSVLGDVIKSLGDLKGRRGHIPYRNSTLTTVLKDSLGGNSHVVMISAVSPSSLDYEETMSTLKYSDRAKKVRIRVEANITSGIMATDATAAELVPILQAEVQKLRELLGQQQIERDKHMGRGLSELQLQSHIAKNNNIESKWKERVQELELQLMEREKLIVDLKREHMETSLLMLENSDLDDSNVSSKSVHQALKSDNDYGGNIKQTSIGTVSSENISRNIIGNKNSAVSMNNVLDDYGSGPASVNVRGKLSKKSDGAVVLATEATDINIPRMINLNQYPMFSECLVYYLTSAFSNNGRISSLSVVAGSKESDVDIYLTGPDILPLHCMFNVEGNDIYITPMSQALVFVNGDVLTGSGAGSSKKLQHKDRIAIGRFHLFRYEAGGEAFGHSSGEVRPNWEFAQNELLEKSWSEKAYLPNSNLLNKRSTSGSQQKNMGSPSSTGANGSSPQQQKKLSDDILIRESHANRSLSQSMNSSNTDKLVKPTRSQSPLHVVDATFANSSNTTGLVRMSADDSNKVALEQKNVARKRVSFSLDDNNMNEFRRESNDNIKNRSNFNQSSSNIDNIDNSGINKSATRTYRTTTDPTLTRKSGLGSATSTSTSSLQQMQLSSSLDDSRMKVTSAVAGTDAEDDIDPDNFTKEAIALQKELADMQLALKDRMSRYERLTKK